VEASAITARSARSDHTRCLKGARGFFNSFHIADSGPGGIVVRDWEMIRGDVYAVKTYQQTTAVGREDTIFELRHAPD